LIADSVVIGSLEDYCLWTVYCYKLHTKGTRFSSVKLYAFGYETTGNCYRLTLDRAACMIVWRRGKIIFMLF